MTRNIVRRRLSVATLLFTVAVGASAACGSSDSNETFSSSSSSSPSAAVRSYVGAAQGTAAFVAVVVDGSRALAYVCDGVPGDPSGTPPTIQVWFNGSSDGRVVDVQGHDGSIQLQLGATDMTGTLTLADGRKVLVNGRAVGGDAGLYRAEADRAGEKAVAGWILAPDGEQRGGVGDTGRFSGVRALNPAQPAFTFEGLATARIAKVGITPIPIP